MMKKFLVGNDETLIEISDGFVGSVQKLLRKNIKKYTDL
jgi:hypothetical protein